MEKYLIVGLGNPGREYEATRHNTGFMILDAFAKASNIVFEDKRYGFVTSTMVKGRKLFLLKPSTFMNLSGNAVRYWLDKENIPQEHLLVVVDDLALPLGALRLKGNGSNGGHNGLGHIQQLIGPQYARLRVGIGNEFPRGGQVDWVLGEYDEEELKTLQPAIEQSIEIIKSFALKFHRATINKESLIETVYLINQLCGMTITALCSRKHTVIACLITTQQQHVIDVQKLKVNEFVLNFFSCGTATYQMGYYRHMITLLYSRCNSNSSWATTHALTLKLTILQLAIHILAMMCCNVDILRTKLVYLINVTEKHLCTTTLQGR